MVDLKIGPSSIILLFLIKKLIEKNKPEIIVQKITITASRAEITCIQDNTGELKKAIQTKKKLKKALGDNDEPIQR